MGFFRMPKIGVAGDVIEHVDTRQCPSYTIAIGDAALHDFNIVSGIAEIHVRCDVEDPDAMSVRHQLLNQMATDKPRAACHQTSLFACHPKRPFCSP